MLTKKIMKKTYLFLFVLAFVLVSTPVFAEKDQKNENNHGKNSEIEIQEESHGSINGPSSTGSIGSSVTLSVTSTVTPKDEQDQGNTGCDPDDNWRNHGKYVSCIARLHLGGEETSEAGRSDEGKRGRTPSVTPSVTPSTSPSVSPTTTPSVTPSTSPSATPSISPTPEVSVTTSALVTVPLEELRSLINQLKRLLGLLKR